MDAIVCSEHCQEPAEHDAEHVICMQDVDAVMVLLNIAEGTSRVHASRRVFEHLHRQQNDIPVIHHRVFPAGLWPRLA